VAFDWETQRLQVTEMIARWRLPDGVRFRVRAEDLDIFELFYHQAEDEWTIQKR
jgi:hypothetical protein